MCCFDTRLAFLLRKNEPAEMSVYYLGDSNLLWSEEAERMFLDRVASSPLGYGRTCGSSILLGDKWDLIENLMAHGVNPRSRLIRFSKNSSFHYFTVDEMGLRLMKLALDEMALYRFQRYLQQNGICKASTERKYASCRRACSSRGTADRTNARCHNGGCHRGAAAGH